MFDTLKIFSLKTPFSFFILQNDDATNIREFGEKNPKISYLNICSIVQSSFKSIRIYTFVLEDEHTNPLCHTLSRAFTDVTDHIQ